MERPGTVRPPALWIALLCTTDFNGILGRQWRLFWSTHLKYLNFFLKEGFAINLFLWSPERPLVNFFLWSQERPLVNLFLWSQERPLVSLFLWSLSTLGSIFSCERRSPSWSISSCDHSGTLWSTSFFDHRSAPWLISFFDHRSAPLLISSCDHRSAPLLISFFDHRSAPSLISFFDHRSATLLISFFDHRSAPLLISFFDHRSIHYSTFQKERLLNVLMCKFVLLELLIRSRMSYTGSGCCTCTWFYMSSPETKVNRQIRQKNHRWPSRTASLTWDGNFVRTHTGGRPRTYYFPARHI